jgi:hypothetical protein
MTAWIATVIVILAFMSGCKTLEQDEVICDNHYGMKALCKDPRFKDDIQCTNPCG